MCWLSWNLWASTYWNPLGLSRPVMGLLYPYSCLLVYLYFYNLQVYYFVLLCYFFVLCIIPFLFLVFYFICSLQGFGSGDTSPAYYFDEVSNWCYKIYPFCSFRTNRTITHIASLTATFYALTALLCFSLMIIYVQGVWDCLWCDCRKAGRPARTTMEASPRCLS